MVDFLIIICLNDVRHIRPLFWVVPTYAASKIFEQFSNLYPILKIMEKVLKLLVSVIIKSLVSVVPLTVQNKVWD